MFGGRCHWLAATLHAHDESIKTHCTKRLFDLIANMNAVVHVQLNKHKDLISLSWNNPTVLNIQSMLTIPVWPADLCLFKQRNETCFFLKDQMNVFTSFQTCWVKRGNRFTLFLLVFFAVTKSLYLSLCWCWAEGALFSIGKENKIHWPVTWTIFYKDDIELLLVDIVVFWGDFYEWEISDITAASGM